VFRQKQKKQEQNSRVENATWGCVLHDISRYITPHCISEDQLTLKWQIRIHKCQKILPHTNVAKYYHSKWWSGIFQ